MECRGGIIGTAGGNDGEGPKGEGLEKGGGPGNEVGGVTLILGGDGGDEGDGST